MSKIPLDHTDLPLFSRYFTSIDMVIFFVMLAVSAVCACLFVWGWFPWRCQGLPTLLVSECRARAVFFLLLLAALFLQVLLLTSTLSSREI
jgi:hypothetical protein